MVALPILALLECIILFRLRDAVSGKRNCSERFSNGDQNSIYLSIQNKYSIPVLMQVIDEAPVEFEIRNFNHRMRMKANSACTLHYTLRPVRRGIYHFGYLRIYVNSPLGLVSRRFILEKPQSVSVYPSYLQLRKFELLAISNRLTDLGIKKIRKIGHNREFDQIKEYVAGDDIRTINWKATARKSYLMVNTYQDEKSQQLYCIIDKGRTMKMPFEDMSLLDYAINSSLVLSNIAIRKEDKAGLLTYSNKLGHFVKADKKPNQMARILEALYSQDMEFKESDVARLYMQVSAQIKQRSLLMLYTNFESLVSLHRQLPSLRKIASQHLLVVVFFENTELRSLTQMKADRLEEVYVKAIAEKFAFEKRQIAKELQRYGIHCILTSPEQLTVSSVNKYLELKARGMI
ncbi:MAG: DUF58 domain-containing protein [Cytophagaceae bacterium]|nr:DUF58 domain-containing protein [Cytophagaceae bacterium]